MVRVLVSLVVLWALLAGGGGVAGPAGASAVVSLATAGRVSDVTLIEYTGPEQELYEQSAAVSRVGAELLVTAGTMGLSRASQGVGAVLNVLDKAQNRAELAEGVSDIAENGLTWSNAAQTVAAIAGTRLESPQVPGNLGAAAGGSSTGGSWTKAREDYWKGRSKEAAEGEFSPANLDRMRQGKPPLHDEVGVPKELHHKVPQREGGPHTPDNLDEVWP